MIPASNNCVGCGACKNACPVDCIKIDRLAGQYIPFVDSAKCIKCGGCDSVCVSCNIEKLKFYSTTAAFYGYVEDQNNRIKSSSGGVFYAIATEFIKRGGVVVGAAFDDSFCVKHIVARDLNDLKKIRGSKYVESDLQYVFHEIKIILQSGKDVLFSGVPCQIGAIKTYLKKDYNNLYTCEVFCHGAPRSGIFNSYVDWIKKRLGNIKHFNFRSKYYEWSKPAYEIETDNKTIIERHKDNVYHLMFGKHVSLRDSCYNCQFRKELRSSDLSLGDFWGIEKFYPTVKTRDGISAILVNNERGDWLLSIARLRLFPCSIDEIYDKNKWMIMNYKRPVEQNEFIDDYCSMNADDFFRKYKFKYMVIDRVKSLIKRLFL